MRVGKGKCGARTWSPVVCHSIPVGSHPDVGLDVHPGLAREDVAACTTKIEQTGRNKSARHRVYRRTRVPRLRTDATCVRQITLEKRLVGIALARNMRIELNARWTIGVKRNCNRHARNAYYVRGSFETNSNVTSEDVNHWFVLCILKILLQNYLWFCIEPVKVAKLWKWQLWNGDFLQMFGFHYTKIMF